MLKTIFKICYLLYLFFLQISLAHEQIELYIKSGTNSAQGDQQIITIDQLSKEKDPKLAAVYKQLKSKPLLSKVSKYDIEIYQYPFKSKNLLASLPEAELLSMAVGKSFQGTGIGTQLFNRFAMELKRKGCNNFKIVVWGENQQANRFYQSMGCRLCHQTEIHAREVSNVYIYDCK